MCRPRLLPAVALLAACSAAGPPSSDARGGADALQFHDGAGAPSDAAPGADAGATDLAPLPTGLAALGGLRELYRLRLDVLAAQRSSYDRSGGNADGFGASNFLYTDAAGERVLADEVGPGCLYNLWLTGADAQRAWLKAYFDGEATPRLQGTLQQLFGGQQAPLLWPLVLDPVASSGGYTLHLPLPYARALRLTTNGVGEHFFYHVGLHRYDAQRQLGSWRGAEPVAAAQALLQNLGASPHAATAAAQLTAKTVDVPAGGEALLLDTGGPGLITALRLRLPGLARGEVSDAGRAHKGSSRFVVRIAPHNEGVRLLRRLDGCVGGQTVRVFVDEVAVGSWSDGAAQAGDCWRDSSFVIARAHTAGRSQLALRLEYAAGDPDVNEFTYWILSRSAAGEQLSDVLDVGHPASEAAHGYAIAGQTWSGLRAMRYPRDPALARELLDALRLRCSWDDAATPDVDATLGELFALGRFGDSGFAASLLVGIDHDDTLYAYFPMPFRRRARIALVSGRASATPGVQASIAHEPLAGGFRDAAYFKTASRHHVHAAHDGTDLVALDVAGAGHFVGLVQSVRGPASRAYLEGDERIHVDGSASPAYHGTGTEDLYQGGWYFQYGPFARATHGNAAHAVGGGSDGTAMYRLFVPDVVPFRTGLRVSLEHGTRNDTAVEAWTLAYYYHRPEPACRPSDELDVGQAASETAHGYAISGQSWAGRRELAFEGERDGELVADDGRAHKGSARFALTIEPANDGVLLRRRFDQSVTGARAELLVDGQPAATWYHPGGNGTSRWREEDLLLPAALTRGKSRIAIEERFLSSSGDFNAFRYRAWSCSWPR